MGASADLNRVSIVEESTPGTTPATPTFEICRIRDEDVTFEPVVTQSQEITGDGRGVSDDILAGGSVAGTINFELAASDSFDLFLGCLFASDWGDDPGLTPAVGADDMVDQAARRTLTLERRIQVSDTPTYNYHRYANLDINTLSLNMTPNEVIAGSLGVIGEALAVDTAIIAGATYNAASSDPVMTAPLVTGLYLATYGSETAVAWLSAACFTQAALNVTNNINAIACIGSLGTDHKTLGKFNCTITGTLLYAGNEMLSALLARTEFAFVIQCEDSNGYAYRLVFPRVKISAASTGTPGTGQNVIYNFTIQALKDATAGYTCKITRG